MSQLPVSVGTHVHDCVIKLEFSLVFIASVCMAQGHVSAVFSKAAFCVVIPKGSIVVLGLLCRGCL